ncbi:histidine phosphatase family protein [Virgibacillus kekensis]|uniref:Histidine phosphatase family protein n=1 Tax=Virgibacillus kekensis TaxID=202261 RepID=A0ABV9DKS5_9BACI
MTRIGIIRHGTTAWNKERRAQGSSDIPLDQDGIAQARQLAERMKNEKWDYIYSSNLSRAQQTAEVVAEKLGIPVQVDPRIREVGGGLIEGTTPAERVEKWGEKWWEEDLQFEPTEKVISRGLSFFDEISEKHRDKNILVVSHGSFIKHLVKEIVPLFKVDESLKNTSVTVLDKNDEGWDCSLFNCTKHLKEI